MTTLELALRARLPLVTVRTDDPLNVGKVLTVYAEEDVRPFYVGWMEGRAMAPSTPKYTLQDDGLYFHVGDCQHDYATLFGQLAEKEATLVVVNPSEPHPAMFDAGQLVLPESMITDFVHEYADGDEDEHDGLVAALRGLSLKEMVEVSKLAMAASNEFTADAVLSIRRQRASLSSGLQLVDTAQDFYQPPGMLRDWLTIDGRLFRHNVARVLRPRGLLFKGDPGTGKTSGAKFLAHSLGVPLYALDVGSTMQKYVGESERTFSGALAQIERLAPCVLLLDEIEKAFASDDDSGVSRRVLGMLLWWLQEHQSQVLTIMTTNDADALPPELIRPGRIDATVTFYGLAHGQAYEFAQALRKHLTNVSEVSSLDVKQLVDANFKQTAIRRPQAEVTGWVVTLAKAELARQLKE